MLRKSGIEAAVRADDNRLQGTKQSFRTTVSYNMPHREEKSFYQTKNS